VARVKVKDSEKLDPSNIRHVINLLESDKPITKKEACSLLRISYNTTRLGNIITGFNDTPAGVTQTRIYAKKPYSPFHVFKSQHLDAPSPHRQCQNWQPRVVHHHYLQEYRAT